MILALCFLAPMRVFTGPIDGTCEMCYYGIQGKGHDISGPKVVHDILDWVSEFERNS